MLTSPGIEYVACNLCGADDTTTVFRVPTPERYGATFGRAVWDIVKCRCCGLIYVNPRPDNIANRRFYDFENPADSQFVQTWFVEGADLQAPTWRRFVRVLQRYCPAGRLLDVGCGAGSFLVEAQRSGYDVVGQEVSPYFLELLRKQLDIRISSGELEDSGLEPGSFDCVTAFDVIEHHRDPRRLLREMRRLAGPSGVIMISTHDIGNVFARVYGAKWRHIHPIGHLTYFTRQTLTRMIQSCGFRIIDSGGLHTIDAGWLRETRNWVTESIKAILLRSLILGVYRPLATRIPTLTLWRVRWGHSYMTHDRLMLRTGGQLIMNDDLVILAVVDSAGTTDYLRVQDGIARPDRQDAEQ